MFSRPGATFRVSCPAALTRNRRASTLGPTRHAIGEECVRSEFTNRLRALVGRSLQGDAPATVVTRSRIKRIRLRFSTLHQPRTGASAAVLPLNLTCSSRTASSVSAPVLGKTAGLTVVGMAKNETEALTLTESENIDVAHTVGALHQ